MRKTAMLTAALALGLPLAFVAADPAIGQAARKMAAPVDPNAKSDKDMKLVTDKLGALGAKPFEQLTVNQARTQPTPADAVKAVLKDQGKPTAPPPDVTTRDIAYQAAAGTQPARVYMPAGAKGPLPVVLYFHGGGWVVADIDTYDAGARALAREGQAMVISAEYRKGPENRFPAAHLDAVAAYKWTLANAVRLGGDPTRIAVAGESAGGNLAANVAIAARDQRLRMPVHMVLVYPVAGSNMNTPSYTENAKAKPLGKGGMQWFVKHALPNPAAAKDPRIDLVGAANLRGLPPATIINAEIDPLRSEGEQLAAKLKTAGVAVKQMTYQGVAHEFFGMDAVVADAKAAQAMAGRELKVAFASKPRQAVQR